MTEVATTDSSSVAAAATAVKEPSKPDSNGVSEAVSSPTGVSSSSEALPTGNTTNEVETKVKQETNNTETNNSTSITETATVSSTPPAVVPSATTAAEAEPATSKKSSADAAAEDEEASEEDEEDDEEEADEADTTTDAPNASGASAPSPATGSTPAPILATTELNEEGQTMEDVKPASSTTSSSDQSATDLNPTVKSEESPSPATSSTTQPRTADGFAVPLPPAAASNNSTNARTTKASRISRAMRESQPAKNSTGDVTHCPCGDNLDQEGFMIQCETCEIWQHGACVGLTEKTTPEQYYCENCNPDDPIHIAFRKQHGDHIPVKGKGKRSKTKGTVPPATPAVAASKDGKPVKEGAKKPGRVPKDKTEGGAGSAEGANIPSTAGNKRKREPDGTTPKQPRGAIRKGDDASSAGVASPDLAKRPRLEESNSNSSSLPPSTPVPSVKLPSYNPIDFPDLPTMDSSSASELAALAADLDAQGDLTPQGSREARKIQRYIQMIQKMEDKSKGNRSGLSTTNEEGEDVDMEDEDGSNGNGVTIQSLNDDSAAPQGLNSSFASARAAREARAKLRAEKLEKSEKDAEKRDANGNVIEDDKENGTGKKKKKGSARKEDEMPQLSAAEIRRLRTTAASQLRPLGPMYFGKKQLLLQAYRDEALRCDIGWSAPIHQQVPMAKRVVRNYLYDQTSNTQLDQVHQHIYHHTHERPPVAFPVHLPWIVRKDAKKSAMNDKDASRDDKNEGDKSGDNSMDVDSGAAPTNNRRAGSPSVKLENSDLSGSADEPLPAPEAFFKSIDTSALPTKIQELITSFSNGSRSASPLASVVTTQPVVEEPSADVAMEDVTENAPATTTNAEAAVTVSAVIEEKSGEASVAVKVEETVAAASAESKEAGAEAEDESAEDAPKIEEVTSEDAPVSADVPEPKIETASEASGKADEADAGAASTEPAADVSVEPESVDAAAAKEESAAAPTSTETDSAENTTMETLD